MLHKTGNFRDTETYAYRMLWQDVRQPEVLYLLASSQERLRKPAEAAASYALFLRVLDEAKAAGTDVPAEAAKQRPIAERRLKALKRDEQALTASYAKKAAGKKFESPEKVDDGWMDTVQSDLFSLHGLYAWKLVGGRKDAKPDWVHNTKGALHRSGAKYVDEAEGRKGLLFSIPLKDVKSEDADEHHRKELDRLGHNSHFEARNVGRGRFARVAVRAYGFPITLKVLADGKELKTEKVATGAWSDLKIELPPTAAKPSPAKPAPASAAAPKPLAKGAPTPAAAKSSATARPAAAEVTGQKVVIEFIVPEGEKWSEGVWVDYFDFFDN